MNETGIVNDLINKTQITLLQFINTMRNAQMRTTPFSTFHVAPNTRGWTQIKNQPAQLVFAFFAISKNTKYILFIKNKAAIKYGLRIPNEILVSENEWDVSGKIKAAGH